ncbi:MAG: nuclear transport factor 2 family protein [Bacteroidetes bacterium]|nr:nuclear transport factor 2 family protein [Bacteroidota bacterium]
MAKFEFYIGNKLTYIDYISLDKFKDGWKIVSKIFYKLLKIQLSPNNTNKKIELLGVALISKA